MRGGIMGGMEDFITQPKKWTECDREHAICWLSGLTVDETAAYLQRSVSTVERRRWRLLTYCAYDLVGVPIRELARWTLDPLATRSRLDGLTVIDMFAHELDQLVGGARLPDSAFPWALAFTLSPRSRLSGIAA